MTTTDVQAERRKHLLELTDTHHRSHHGDYDDSYAAFAAEYGLPWDGEEPDEDAEPVAIPKYAAVREDETYGMVECFDSLPEAIAAESSGVGEEYLMNPGGVYDLDTGERVQTRNVGLSEEAFIVLCGLVQPDWMAAETPKAEAEAVNRGGIYTDCWDELRRVFPLETFRKAAAERGEDFYQEEAGL